jgi:hypothetical protein
MHGGNLKLVFFLLNAAFVMAILDLISHVHLPSFVNILPKYLKHFGLFKGNPLTDPH